MENILILVVIAIVSWIADAVAKRARRNDEQEAAKGGTAPLEREAQERLEQMLRRQQDPALPPSAPQRLDRPTARPVATPAPGRTAPPSADVRRVDPSAPAPPPPRPAPVQRRAEPARQASAPPPPPAPARPAPAAKVPAKVKRRVGRLKLDPRAMRRIAILSEIYGKPLALRETERF